MSSRISTLILALVVIGIGVFAFSSRTRGHRDRRGDRPPGGMDKSAAGLMQISQMSGLSVAPESRFFCSQADQTGLYTVSFRGMRTDLAEQQRLPLGFAPPGPLGTFTLILQVTASEEMLPLRRLDVRSIRATDNTGYQFGASDPDTAPEPVGFAGGQAYSMKMQAPSPEATSLRSIEGSLVGVGLDQGRPALRFHISDLPLPNSERLFGQASALQIRGMEAPSSLKVITGQSIEEPLKAARPASIQEAYIPQRMVLGPGLTNRLFVPSPANGRPIELKTDAGPLGVIDVEVRQDSERWHGKVWDGDTILIEPKGARGVMALKITRDSGPVPGPLDAGSLFPPVDASPAGMITSSVLVNGKPFGWARMRISMSHREGGKWTDARSTLITVRPDGSVAIPNLVAGEYRLERPSAGLTPYVPGASQVDLNQYLRLRFGAVNGKWTNEQTSAITVRSGQATRVPALEWRPASQAATSDI